MISINLRVWRFMVGLCLWDYRYEHRCREWLGLYLVLPGLRQYEIVVQKHDDYWRIYIHLPFVTIGNGMLQEVVEKNGWHSIKHVWQFSFGLKLKTAA